MPRRAVRLSRLIGTPAGARRRARRTTPARPRPRAAPTAGPQNGTSAPAPRGAAASPARSRTPRSGGPRARASARSAAGLRSGGICVTRDSSVGWPSRSITLSTSSRRRPSASACRTSSRSSATRAVTCPAGSPTAKRCSPPRTVRSAKVPGALARLTRPRSVTRLSPCSNATSAVSRRTCRSGALSASIGSASAGGRARATGRSRASLAGGEGLVRLDRVDQARGASPAAGGGRPLPPCSRPARAAQPTETSPRSPAATAAQRTALAYRQLHAPERATTHRAQRAAAEPNSLGGAAGGLGARRSARRKTRTP